MTKKSLWLGILVLALVFGMTVVGCSNGTTDNVETWSVVTSMFQLEGTWKGSTTYLYPHPSLDITATATYEMTMNVVAANTTKGTATGTIKVTESFFGSDLVPNWPGIKDDLEDVGFTVNDATHSGTRTDTMGSEIVTLSDMGVVMINQNGTKVMAEINSIKYILIKQ